MQVKALSATAIKDYLQCKLKIIFRYDKEVPSIRNDHAKFGTAVHEALEQFTLRMMSKKSFPDPSDYEFAVSVFMSTATEEGMESLDFYSEGRRIVTDYVDNFDPAEEILAVEYKFRIETPDGVPITGAIDKVVKIDEDTIAIVDYKTARNAVTAFELKDDIQLSMYDLAASIIWPQFKNRILLLDFVRINKPVNSVRSDQDRQVFREFLKSIWKQINELDEQEVAGRLNRLCGWCDYKTHCPAYARFIMSKELPLIPLTEVNDANFLEQWEEVSDKKSILESRQRELKMVAHEKFMRGDLIRSKDKELYSTQQARTSYEVEQVVELIPREDVLSVLSVNNTRLNRYAKEDPALKNKLSQIAQISYNQPIYKTRAVKGVDPIDVEAAELEGFDEDASAA